MICPKCSAEVKETSKFCTKCGTKIPKSIPKETVCPNITDTSQVCRNTIRSDEKFCAECGWEIIDKAFETGTYMCSAKGEKCKNLISPEESFCNECGSPTKECSTPKGLTEETLNSSEDSKTQEGNPDEAVVDSDISRSTISNSSSFSRSDVDRRKQNDQNQNDEVRETNSSGNSSPDVYPNSKAWAQSFQDSSKKNTTDQQEENDDLQIRAEDADGIIKKDDENQTKLNVNIGENTSSLPKLQDDTKGETTNKSEENNIPARSEDNENPEEVDEKRVKEDSQTDSDFKSKQNSTQCGSNENETVCNSEVSQTKHGSTSEPLGNQLKIICDDDQEDEKNKIETANEDGSSRDKKFVEYKSNHAAKTPNEISKTSANGTSVDTMPCEVKTLDEIKVSGNPKEPNQGLERAHTMCTRSRSRQENSNDVTIEFHAIASKSFLPDPKSKIVGIRFNLEEMGGWRTVHYCDVIRQIENDEGCEIFLRKTFPRHLLKTKFPEYKYCVMYPKADFFESEYFYWSNNRNNDDLSYTRRLFWSETYGEFWQQYDGVINAVPEKTMFQWLWDNYESGLLQNLKIFMRHCCPLIEYLNQNSNSTASEVLQSLEMMFKSLEETYFYPLKYWKKKSLDDFRKHLNKDLLEALAPCLSKITTEKQMELSTGMLLLYVSKEYSITFLPEVKAAIFQSFLLDTSKDNKISPKYEKLKEEFGDFIEYCGKTLEHAITSERDSDDPLWLCCIPVCHFLNGKCVPFEDLPNIFSHNAEKPIWWGKVGIHVSMDNLKGKTNWKRSPHDMLLKLATMFDMDYLLPRSFMAVLQLEKLESIVSEHLIPPEVVLAGMFYYVKKGTIPKAEKVQIGIVCFREVIRHLQCIDRELEAMTQTTKTRITLTVKICSDVLQTTLMRCTKKKFPAFAIAAIATYLTSASLFEKCIETKTSGGETEFMESLGKNFSQIKTWVQAFAFDEFVDHLKVWNDIIGIDISSEKLRQHFLLEMTSVMEASLTNRITSSAFVENLITIYCKDGDKFHDAVQGVLGKIAIQALAKGKYSNKDDLTGNQKFGEMMSELFERKWEETGMKNNLLLFALSWPPMIQFFTMFYEKRVEGILTNVCQKQLTEVAAYVDQSLKDLVSGSIRLEDLELVRNAEERFMDMNAIIWKYKSNSDMNRGMMHGFLRLRLKEVQKLQDTYEDLRAFAQLCQQFQDSIPDFQTFSMPEDEIRLNQVFKTAKVVEEFDVEKIKMYDPELQIQDIPTDLIKCLPKLRELSEGTVFITMWRKEGLERKANLGRPLTINEIFESVWKKVDHRWKKLQDKLESGEITFKEFEIYFSRMDIDSIKKELNFFCKSSKIPWIEARYSQIQQYKILRQCLTGAGVILDFMEEFELKGNFSAIERIVEMEANDDIPMKELDDDMMTTCGILQDIKKNEIECIRTLIRCKEVVLWLQRYMKNLQELNVFTDLATMTAGEGDMEVDKVNFLHSATRGYAALIFSLDKSCDYAEFITRCKVVWRELAADPNLPEKMKDTNRNLDWFDSVRQSQGSVEVSSMEQAKAINAAGIYVIGKLQEDSHTHKLNVDDVLQLHIQDDSQEQRLRRKYHYKELQELQSKLMLVAGKAEKGKEDVDRFTLVLDSVVRLCNVYIKLVQSGCVLFTNWQARFLCDPRRPVCAFIKFGFGKECTQLKGRRNDADDVTTIMPEIAKFMEDCLEEWLTYIDGRRDEYFHLNYYTIDQVVILQRELARLNADNEISDRAIPLLSIVNTDCTYHDVLEAMEKANEEVEELETREEGITVGEINISEEDIVANFIHEMVEAGHKQIVAREALASGIDPNDIDEGLLWCIENEGNIPDKEGKKSTSAAKMTLLATNEQILNTLASIGDSSIGPLIEDLKQLWTTFQTSVSSNLADYLSVKHLAIVLKYVSQKGSKVIERDFLPCFQVGVPNLLVCCQDDVINTILSVYCQDTKQPLPRPDEVLMCTQETSINEVEIFWRRALYDDCGKIYCLANVEHLNYDVSDKGERRLDYHMQRALTKEIKFKLVAICGSEQENSSRIVAALDKYRRPPLPLMSHQVLLPYLREKLTADMTKMPVVPAAAVDFECCTVRVIKSWRSGVGKTLYKKRSLEKLNLIHKRLNRAGRAASITIPIHEKKIEIDEIMSVLLKNTTPTMEIEPRIFHIDLSHEVEDGVDYLLFQLLVLGCLTDSYGYVWRKSPYDLYLVESLPILSESADKNQVHKYFHRCLEILPDIVCRSPLESFGVYKGSKKPEGFRDSDALFDQQEFESTVFQRPFQYLMRMDTGQSMAGINLKEISGTPQGCLQTLLRHCGVVDPSWSELRNFVWFLNTQLLDFEQSDYVSDAAAEFLPGFSKFVLKFLIQMSRDFASRSLNLSEETPNYASLTVREEREEVFDTDIRKFQMRRTWENSPHPYLFFNPDHNTMTFVGFTIDRWTGNLMDYKTKKVIEKAILPKDLGTALYQNNVNMNEDFDRLKRQDKLQKLCSVMGLKKVHDPDSTYELTMDNVKKILAIYMRFRCDIPVIIMGETGCGKTRLIQFMCQLQCPDVKNIKNMLVMKVHGGTKRADIINKVKEAELEAKRNSEIKDAKNMYTVLFFDEANTTEAIGVIKEIMCDKTICGEPVDLCQSLKIVAACNPYRKHSKKMIERLEQAGLGYHVDAEGTTDRMGRIPMRRLVYRVQPLPQSLLPLVWDFGQLDTSVEETYIRQMVLRYIKKDKVPDVDGIDESLAHILTTAQKFMRNQKDECSFVSLRDVERVLDVFSWFYTQTENGSLLLDKLDCSTETDESSSEDDEEDYSETENTEDVSNLTQALVLALGVCYHACLKNRDEFRFAITETFMDPFYLPHGQKQMLELIERCQSLCLEEVKLEENIAKNKALKENVFMMLVCIELRIPLFLVGKPGSSKSLAKTIVADAMQGNSSYSQLFRNFKQVKMVSFQCSPLSIAEGIIATFRQCAKYQKDGDLKKFVSVVVLDEVGLAEDSPKMPLKTLHPLLENGCLEDEEPEPHRKVAFIGISNWALDPAKMNRGILVQRETPDLDELTETATGICPEEKRHWIAPLIKPLAEAYRDVFKAVLKKREFFGLRDFYSLIKMIYAFTVTNQKRPTWLMLKHSIKRNFGGMEEEDVNALEIFEKRLSTFVTKIEQKTTGDPDCTPTGLIKACLHEKQSRYLLLLTENYGALSVLQQKVLKMNAITIFGSSFQSDQQYTQVCRNINRIKVCMETGATVILLNLENLYESLYDALNQYYVYLGGERYVDLGLGSHRVKCRVHKDFRLIVVAEKDVVYRKFPIPLINRLEKHFLNISTMLSPLQMELTRVLEQWVEDFITPIVPVQAHHFKKKTSPDLSKMDVFIGYHADMCASIVLHVCHEQFGEENEYNGTGSGSDTEEESEEFQIHDEKIKEKILKDSKDLLLWSVTPDAVLRLGKTKLKDYEKDIRNQYFFEQKHDSLSSYLVYHLTEEKKNICLQVTTHSKLLTSGDLEDISRIVEIENDHISLLSLQSFYTEQQFCRQLRCSFEKSLQHKMFLIVQCDNGIENANLIACARYCVLDELQQLSDARKEKTNIVFIIHLPRMSSGHFAGFQCGVWKTVHIDDIRSPDNDIPRITEMVGKSIGTLIENATKTKRLAQSVLHSSSVDDEENVAMHMRENEEELIDHSKQVALHRNFNFPALVKMCVHSSLAMIKDTDGSDRATHRVKVLIRLLHDTGNQDDVSFIMGICLHMSTLMKEKENEFTGDVANVWLTTEATSRDHINRVGTFRMLPVVKYCFPLLDTITLEGVFSIPREKQKAMTQCVVDKLAPLLAGIISKVDTNRNLDILTEGDWKQHLWLQVINCPEATNIKYSMFISPHGLKQMSDFTVSGTGFDGHIFSAKLPFSWMIFRLVDNAVLTRFSMKSEQTDIREQILHIVKIVEDRPLGRLLAASLREVCEDEYTTAYIHDFIHMVYPKCSEEELQLVCDDLKIGCQLLFGEEDKTKSSVYWIVAIHVAFEKSSHLFQNFNCISQVWSNCGSVVKEYMKNEENKALVTNKEQILDVVGVCLLLRNLEPKVETFTDTKGRQKWVLMVNKYRPIVERILVEDSHSPLIDGTISKRSSGLQEARYQWTRATVLKLFLEHVCSSNDFHAKRCMILWKMLKGEADLKTIQSLEKIEKFLKICMKEAMKKAFGDQEICKSCESQISERPVQLPCGDVICVRCFKEASIVGQTACPVCHVAFPRDFQPLDKEICSPEIKEFNTFKKCCNGFYMDVVSQLCFSDDKAPSSDVIQKLMLHIATVPKSAETTDVMSKEISIFDEGIDPSPVLRSFLLQHLLRTSDKDVRTYLKTYLQNAQNLFKNEEGSLLELSVMIINCLEDSHSQECSKMTDARKAELKMALQMLSNNAQNLQEEPFGIEKVVCLSESRFGLKLAADCLYKIVVTKNLKKTKYEGKVLDAAEKFCENSGSNNPRIFIIKYICQCYGVESFQAICNSKVHSIVDALDLPELHMNQIIQCSDRFIVCGRLYQDIREAVVKSIFGRNNTPLRLVLEELQEPESCQRVITLLALFREITLSNVFDPLDKRRVSEEQRKQIVEGCLLENPLFIDRVEVLGNVSRNTMIGKMHVEWIKSGMDLRHQNLICLIFHFFVTVLETRTKQTLLEPLRRLIFEPNTMQDALIPTMPQDDSEELRNIIDATSLEETPVAYRCPNGHIYFIGDCGQPTTLSRCPDCGQKVGGENYNLQQKNKLDQGEDMTAKGYILGDANNRQEDATPERDLSPLECAVLRLFTHMSMYLGGWYYPKALQTLTKPNVPEDAVPDFFWRHMEVDVLVLQKATGKSAEDVYLLLHCICKDFMTEHTVQANEGDICLLARKDARRKWEELFATTSLRTIFKRMDNVIQDVNAEMRKDVRLASDPLTCLLIEEEVHNEAINLNELQNMPVVWRYRSQITMSHLSRTFLAQAPKDEFLILRIFLDEEHHLKAIRLIPNIIKLHKLLVQLYQDRLVKADAAHMSIEKMLAKEGLIQINAKSFTQVCNAKNVVEKYTTNSRRQDPIQEDKSNVEKFPKVKHVFVIYIEGDEHGLRDLVKDFFEAWRCVREHLATFTFLTPKGNRQLPIECSQKLITEKDPISYLLPTFQDNGLCAYALLYFLLKKQNTFLMEYCKRKPSPFKDLPRVHLKDLTTAHLICFNPTKDILPIVMANCQYTFEVEKGTRVQYNFADLERQLMDRILFSKSVIDMPFTEFPIMTYASERTNAGVFRDLRKNVKQEPLAPVVVHQICNEFRSYPDICDSLKKLDIAISFLKSVGGDIEMNLESFMSATLQIESPFPSQKVKMSCQCKHAQALWIALAFTKTKNQSSFQEDAFEGVSDEFRKEMDDKERRDVRNMCQSKEVPLEKMNVLIEMMFECILLQITVPSDEDFDMATLSLRDTLMEYSQTPCYDIIPPKVQEPPDVTDLIQKIPASILNTKATDVWLCIYTMYTEKARPRR